MGLILSLETATDVCSVALHRDGELLGLTEVKSPKSHSRLLTDMIQQLLDNLKFRTQKLDALAVSKGPGSYTGLRIGVSTAKGLCYGLGIPLIGVNTLMGLARQAQRKDDYQLYCPMLDARRMEVYSMVVNNEMEELMPTTPVVVSQGSFSNYLGQGPMLFFGNGSAKCQDYLQHPNARYLEGINASARTIGELAEIRYKSGEFENLAYFEPLYLKEFKKVIPQK